ncbi:RNA polymerase sigma factor [Cohnella nanjingensis]|uniref:RNA polymerase sigma factor n=2 Tax=Cohnella nanjingensis TaxID=1387779 RepID=A0A7X0RZF5_9BACL|nr:RNA polymerase sigma factor [Cohnella nanjingensis]
MAERASERTSAAELERLQYVVQRYCLSLTGSGWEAEDLAQEAWLKALGTKQLRHHPHPEALLLRIAKNAWIDQSRRKANLTRILEGEKRGDTARSDEDGLAIENALHALTLRLSPLQRTVFLLRDVLGYSIAEAAEMLKMTEGAVKAAHHRARRSLDAVQADLEADSLPAPEDDGLKAILRAMAAAYRSGDVAALIELAQQDVVAPAVAIGIVRQRMLSRQEPTARRDGAGPVMQLAA